jgi:hypothetical protein
MSQVVKTYLFSSLLNFASFVTGPADFRNRHIGEFGVIKVISHGQLEVAI